MPSSTMISPWRSRCSNEGQKAPQFSSQMSKIAHNASFPSCAHERSAPFIIDSAYSANQVNPSHPPPSNNNITWLYGEAELECYRLAVLRKRARDAQLKVYYPGTFHTPSPRGLFRVSVGAEWNEECFEFRSNGNVVVRYNDLEVYKSDVSTDIHGVILQDLSQDGHIVIEVTTTSAVCTSTDDEPAEPACIGLSKDSSFPSIMWEGSSDGKEWTCTLAVQAVGEFAYPHLVESPEIHLTPSTKQTHNDVDEDKTLYDFGCELLAHIVIQCKKSPKIYLGESIREALNEDPGHFEQSTDMICVKNGTWQSAHLLAFRYVRVESQDNGDNEISEISCKAVFHPVQYHGAFACSDDLLTQIWMNSAYTLRLCMHDSFIVDGIKRDRLPWTGDLAVSLQANVYTFADASIVRRTLTALGRDGIEESHVNGIVDYSLWWIICQDLYQLYFGDKDYLEREWNRIKAMLVCLLERCNENGFLHVTNEDWVFIDWVDAEKATALQILWWWALDCGDRLAQRVNDTEVVTRLQTQSSNLKDSLVSSCWDEYAGLWRSAPGDRKEYSRHANVLAVISNLSPNDAIQIREALVAKDLSPVGTPYMKTLKCLALVRLGATEACLESIRSYWGRMVENGATTFWEAFNEVEPVETITAFYDRPYGKSLCHAWSSGPCHVLPATILGVRPLTDGWTEWTCDLNLGELEWAVATVPTPKGSIEVETSSSSLRVVVPPETTLKRSDDSSFDGPDIVSMPRGTAADASRIDSNTLKKWSAPYRGWHYYPDHVIPSKPNITSFEDVTMTDVPTVYQLPGVEDKWYMSFIGFNGKGYQSFVAESDDLVNWTNMRLAMGFGNEGEFDFGGCVLGAFLYDDYDIRAPRTLKKKNGKYWSLYGAYAKQGEYEIDPGYEGIASSDDGLTWHRAKEQPILSVHDDDVRYWEKDSIYQPWLIEHEGRYYNFYNAKLMPEWIEQIGMATSTNMFEWTRNPINPVLRVRPDGYDAEFVADGKVFKDDDHWVMFYFGVGKGGAHIMVAFSRDLHNWTADPDPLYKAGGNPSGLDSQYAHKISLVFNPRNETWYMFYDAVGNKGRGIGLITSRPIL